MFKEKDDAGPGLRRERTPQGQTPPGGTKLVSQSIFTQVDEGFSFPNVGIFRRLKHLD